MKVVMYHYIRPINNAMIKGLKSLDIEQFYTQLKFLKSEFDIISHLDLFNFFEKDIKLPPKAMLLTFDDGYLDVYRYALPALLANDIKGSFYVPDYFRNRSLLDVNAIHLLLTKQENIKFYIQFIKSYIEKNIVDKKYDDYVTSININSRYDSKEVVILKKMLQFV